MTTKRRALRRPTRLASLPRTLASGTPALLLLLPVLAAPSSALARPGWTEVVSELPDGVVLRLQTPPISWRSEGGYLYPRIDGFGLLQEKGRPVLPVRVERVAIPAGATPTLTILDQQTQPAPAGSIGPLEEWVPTRPGSAEKTVQGAEDPEVYGRDALYPGDDPVRLGQAGSLREQPFVDLVFTPVLYDPARRESVVTTSITVRIDFGVTPGHGLSRAGADFEEVYDAGLVNAHQSRSFRGTSGAAPVEGARSFEAASTALTSVSTKYKLTVNQDGVYRLSVSWVQSNAPDILNFNVANFRIDDLGAQIPITVVDSNADGTLNGSDYIEFYGQKVAWDILDPDIWCGGSNYTNDNVYWLYADSAAGLRATSRTGAPEDIYTVPTDFTETAHHDVDARFVQQVPQDPIDHWYDDPPMTANSGPATVNYTVDTPGVSTNVATASIKVLLLGDNYANNYHRSKILVNGTAVSGPSDWDGFRQFIQGQDDAPATFNQTLLNTSGTTTVGVNLPLGRTVNSSPVTFDQMFEDWIDITYQRIFKLDNNQFLFFTWPNQNQQFRITNLNNNNSAVYEITKTLAGSPIVNPVRITNTRGGTSGSNFKVDFEITTDGSLPPGAPRRFIVADITTNNATGDLVPASSVAYVPANLHNPPAGVDWLVIANTSLLDSAPASAWQHLLTRRSSQGLRVRVVNVQDAYDEFSFGIADPQGIRDFISYVYASWPRIDPLVPVQDVILIGDASFDYKNNYAWPASKNLLSSYMRSVSANTILGYMSDETYFSTVSGGDSIPDLALGRWPVHTIAETDAVAQKILDYETAAGGQTWQHDDVFVADQLDTTFESVQDTEINTWLAGTPNTYHRTYAAEIAAANPGWTNAQVLTETRTRIQNQLNGNVDATKDIGPGAAVLSFVGHGSWQDWGGDGTFFTVATTGTDDLTPVSNELKLPLLLVADCISGGFTVTSRPSSSVDLTYAYAESFLVRSGKGAIGAIAPSHLTTLNAHQTVEDTFFGEVYGNRKTRNFGKLNAAIQLEFAGIGDTTNVRAYTLFADPAVNLAVPAPRPPTNAVATAGDGQITLTWTASPDASSYNVYESTTAVGTYIKVASSVVGSSKTITGLTNCSAYYFTLTSVDAQGFEGAWSTFNDGCGSGGSCLSATPTPASPPVAPTGLNAVDHGTGGAILVSWSPNPPANDVRNYFVYLGTAPGTYTQTLSAGPTTSLLVQGLTNGLTYYFRVSAQNCLLQEGPKSSQEVTATPHVILGITPPSFIGDLLVFRYPGPTSGNDIQLRWTPPATNIYGSPATIDHQDIYSGTTPTFPADAAHKIGTVSAATNSFVHPGAFSDPSQHYYVVVAVDTNGNGSGVSRQLPNGIDAMTVHRTGGSLNFSWPAVTLDFDGRPTLIDHYALYGRSTVFRRSDIGPALLIQDNIRTTAVTIPVPAGSPFFYSIIAVDNKGGSSPW